MHTVELFRKNSTVYTSINPDYYIIATSSLLKVNDLKGDWQLTVVIPISDNDDDDDAAWKYVEKEAVFRVKTFMPDDQFFNIIDIVKNNNVLTAIAVPIFLDVANDVMLYNLNMENSNPQMMLDKILEGSIYTGESDIATHEDIEFGIQNGLSAILSGQEGSIENTFKGEVLYNNYHIIYNTKIGDDRGVVCEFGYNMTGVTVSENTNDLVTYLIPIAHNDRLLPEKEVVSSNASKYRKKYRKQLKLTDYKLRSDLEYEEESSTIFDTEDELYEAMRNECNRIFTEDEIDIPYVNYEIEMVDLSNMDEYSDVEGLFTVNLGDTIKCINHEIDVETSNRLVSITYDTIYGEVKSLSLGDAKEDINTAFNLDSYYKVENTINNVVSSDGNLMGETIKGLIDLNDVLMKAQKTVTQKTDVRAILFEDLDPVSPTFGALAIGTQGIQISKERTPYDNDWIWTTAINFKSVIADSIITGILSDSVGKNFWNLGTGFINTESGKIGSWTLNEEGLTATYQKVHRVYTQADVDVVYNYVTGTQFLTYEQQIEYDVLGQGYLDNGTRIVMMAMINGTIPRTWNYTYTISPYNPEKFIRIDLDVAALPGFIDYGPDNIGLHISIHAISTFMQYKLHNGIWNLEH